eukprot:gene17368-biopygen6386
MGAGASPVGRLAAAAGRAGRAAPPADAERAADLLYATDRKPVVGTEDMEGGEYVEGAEHGEGIGRRGSRMTPYRRRRKTQRAVDAVESGSRRRTARNTKKAAAVVRSAAKSAEGAEVSESIDNGEGAEYAEDADEVESCGKVLKTRQSAGRPWKAQNMQKGGVVGEDVEVADSSLPWSWCSSTRRQARPPVAS